MKKIILLILCIFLTGCSVTEWEYEINSEFMIFSTSGHNVLFTNSSDYLGDLDYTVVAFKYSKKYLILNVYERIKEQFYYYVIDMNEKTISKEYDSILDYEKDYAFDKNDNFTKWISTTTKPTEAEYCVEKYE